MSEAGVTPALRRRRERAEHQRSLIQEQAALLSPDRELNSLSPSLKLNHTAEVSDENRRNAAFDLLDISREASVKDLTERLQVNHNNLFYFSIIFNFLNSINAGESHIGDDAIIAHGGQGDAGHGRPIRNHLQSQRRTHQIQIPPRPAQFRQLPGAEQQIA